MNMIKFVLFMAFIAISDAAAIESVKPSLTTAMFDGNCNCAMFRNEDNPKWDEPLLVSNPHIPMPHNVEGARSCLRICIALFVASGDNVAKVICSVLQNADDLHVTVYFRLCQEEKWASTKNMNKDPICCKEGDLVDCEDTI